MPDSLKKRLLDPATTPVRELMSHDVICVRPGTTLVEFTRILLENGISGAPVVDDNFRPVGLASRTDLVHAAAEADGTMPGRGSAGVALRSEGCVRNIMTPMAFTIGEEASILDAASLMARIGLHRVVVVSSTGRVAGVLSAYDLVTWIAGVSRAPGP